MQDRVLFGPAEARVLDADGCVLREVSLFSEGIVMAGKVRE